MIILICIAIVIVAYLCSAELTDAEIIDEMAHIAEKE